ncbi:MAG: glycosyltransferase family 2 protein [Nitrospira sp.]|nr:glycosyltransferase family 2 protein [Nitrospira sp.]
MKLAPVVVFAYNRPLHLQRTLDALAACRLAKRTEVHVFADGPRKPAAAEAVAEVRHVLELEARAGRFLALHVHASDVNLGLANSIIRGVGQVLATSDRVIVLEDDLLVTADFLEFMNDCLEYYKDNASIGAVTGFCPLEALPRGYAEDVFVVCRNSSQGWGTWGRVWQDVDWSASGIEKLNHDWALRRAFNQEGNDRYDRLRRQLAGHIDSWSIRFGLSLFLRGLGTVYPAVNRIANIGYDGSGIHSGTGTPKNERIAESPYTLHPVQVDPNIQRAFHRVYSGGARGRLMRDVLACWPSLAGWLGR